MKPTLNKNLKEFVKIAKTLDKNKKIEFVMLYGSHANNKMSDIDLCIYYNDNKKNTFNFRKKVLGRLNEKYDIQIFQNLSLYIKKEVLTGKIIYTKNKRFLYDVAYKTIKEFDHFKKYYYDHISRRKNVKKKTN